MPNLIKIEFAILLAIWLFGLFSLIASVLTLF